MYFKDVSKASISNSLDYKGFLFETWTRQSKQRETIENFDTEELVGCLSLHVEQMCLAYMQAFSLYCSVYQI